MVTFGSDPAGPIRGGAPTRQVDAGLRCVAIKDVGNLTAPVEFTVRVVHP